jgi:hypothetical protein
VSGRLLTTAEVACELGRSAEWIRERAHAGLIPGAHRDARSGRWLYTEEGVEAFRRGGQDAPLPEPEAIARMPRRVLPLRGAAA